MIHDQAAYQRRKKVFDAIGEMDWKKIDARIKYKYRSDRLAKARELGFRYISECTVKLYKKHWSHRKVGRIIGVSDEATIFELRKIGIKSQPKGGYRPGDRRSGNRFQSWDDKLKN